MTIRHLLRRLMGIHEDPYQVIDAYDMTAPVHRPGDKDKYTMYARGASLLAQMRQVRASEVIK